MAFLVENSTPIPIVPRHSPLVCFLSSSACSSPAGSTTPKYSSAISSSSGLLSGSIRPTLYVLGEDTVDDDCRSKTVADRTRLSAYPPNLLRKDIRDNVGEPSLAIERVTKLETLLENASQRTLPFISAEALAEIKESCISGSEELQTLLKSILDANIATAAQASGMENLLTCLIKIEVTEMVNGVVGAIKQGMIQAGKRLRRIALGGGGIRVMGKLVTATEAPEAPEKPFKKECEGVMKR